MGIDFEGTPHSDDDTRQVRTFCLPDKTVKVYLSENVSARRNAIADAIADAKAGDIVAACGKGHEQSLCFGTTEYPWSDQQCIREILAANKV